MKKEIPVYLFTGFLDSGKTTFIQETLEDASFNDGDKALLIVCEEGEEEYNSSKFASDNVDIVYFDEEANFTYRRLAEIADKASAEKIVIEYNGMWLLDTLYNNMPENWIVYQEMHFADSRSYEQYNLNMRQLVYDKLKSAGSVIFKHFEKGGDKLPLHKIVRQANRKCDIIFESESGEIELDNIEDPLPFDISAPVIRIADKDYAMWYADINENEGNYFGKTVKIKGGTLLGGGLKEDEFVIGRHIMTCCADDIQFGGLVAKYQPEYFPKLAHGGWAVITAEIVGEYNDMYGSKGPVLYVRDIILTQPPAEELATFY